MRTLYRAGRVHQLSSPDQPTAGPPPDALLVVGDTIGWVGPAAGAPAADAVRDLPGALIAPAFVDAHVHVTETGLALDGVDLSGAASVTELLATVEAAGRARPDRPVLGHGWDELRLAERRPPTRQELDRASAGAVVYLSRVDVHSAVVSTALADAAKAHTLDGWHDSGRVERDAHHATLAATRTALSRSVRRDLQRTALRAAAAAGIAVVHEMSAPHLADEADLAELLGLTADPAEHLPGVVAYRGQLVSDPEQAAALLADLPRPLAGLAGDLCVDGSVGSRTAAFLAPYADVPGHADHPAGHLYLDPDQIRDHVAACTRVGVQAGFHVIGDAAMDAVVTGFRRAADQLGATAIRAARHRLEHVEAISLPQAGELARLGVIASVQPAFDAAWGGADGMYAERLGPHRALAMNPFAGLAASGVVLAFGSDAPVTRFDPWAAIRAAVHHREPGHRLSAAAAFDAHTRGGWRASGPTSGEGAGTLTAGAPATFAAWDPAPGLDLDPDGEPRCLLTVHDGRVLHDSA